MGIFSTIGGLFGPMGAAIGGIGDGILGASAKRKQAKRQNAMEMNKYANLRKAAEAGGFHPLAVLQAGGSVNMQAAPRLLTSLSASNAFDALEDEISGEGAKARERQDVRDEIERLEAQRLKYEVAASTRTRPTIGPMDEGGTRFGGPSQRPEARPGYWTGKSVPVVDPTGNTIQMPARLAERLGIKAWDPIIADDMEGIAGDEISQVLFGDWLAANGLKMRGGNQDGTDVYSSGDLWDDIKGAVRPPRIPSSATTKPKGWRGLNN